MKLHWARFSIFEYLVQLLFSFTFRFQIIPYELKYSFQHALNLLFLVSVKLFQLYIHDMFSLIMPLFLAASIFVLRLLHDFQCSWEYLANILQSTYLFLEAVNASALCLIRENLFAMITHILSALEIKHHSVLNILFE